MCLQYTPYIKEILRSCLHKFCILPLSSDAKMSHRLCDSCRNVCYQKLFTDSPFCTIFFRPTTYLPVRKYSLNSPPLLTNGSKSRWEPSLRTWKIKQHFNHTQVYTYTSQCIRRSLLALVELKSDGVLILSKSEDWRF